MDGKWLRKPKAEAGSTAIVFVHGFRSNNQDCWTHKNGSYWPELVKADKEFDNAGIYVFDYLTSFSNPQYNLDDVVDSLRAHLGIDKVLNSPRLVFVCHSMGGIVVRKYIIVNVVDLINQKKEIGLFLIASPSLGSDYANWFYFLSLLKHSQVDVLRFHRDNLWLNDVTKQFRKIVLDRHLILYGKELIEEKFVIMRRLLSKPVVEPFSGATFFGEPFKVGNSDHFSIAKPEDATAMQHLLLRKFIEDMNAGEEERRRGVSVPSRRYSRVLDRGGTDQISALADAALYFPRQRFGYKKEIREHVLNKEFIPTLYYYCTEEGAEFWIKMSSDSRYRFQSNSLALMRAFSETFAQSISAPFDFISLGSGDGEKDRILLEAVAKRATESIFYYPIDISDKLLVECVRNVFKGGLARSKIRTRAILGDFCDLGVLRAVYEDRPVRNVFSILGNTLGNTDEAKILNALKDAMYSGDLLLLEVNCATKEISEGNAFLRSDFVRQYCSLPLSIIGVDVDVTKVEIHEVDGLSVFKAAKSVETTYREAVLEGRTLTNIPLEHDHRYDFKMLQNELAEQLKLDVIASKILGSAGIVLATKR